MSGLKKHVSIFDDDFPITTPVNVRYRNVAQDAYGNDPIVGIAVSSARRTDYFVGPDDPNVIAVNSLLRDAQQHVTRVMGKHSSGFYQMGGRIVQWERPSYRSVKTFDARVGEFNYRATLTYFAGRSTPAIAITAVMGLRGRVWTVAPLTAGSEFSIAQPTLRR